MTNHVLAGTAQSQLKSRFWHKAARFSLYAILGIFALFYIMPLFVMVITSLKSLDEIHQGGLLSLPENITFEPWKVAWSSACAGVSCVGLKGYFLNSMVMVVPAVLISTLIGAINGYALMHWKFKGSEIIFALLLFGCFIPFQIVLLPMAILLGKIKLSGSFSGLIMVHAVYGIPFTTMFFRNYYMTIPTELVKAAKIDGAGFFRIFYSIFLPLSPPIIVVTIIWEFTNIWNDFLFGISFSEPGTQPITVALNNIVNSTTGVKEYNVDMAAAIIAALPTLLVYIVAGKYFIRGLSAGSVKG